MWLSLRGFLVCVGLTLLSLPGQAALPIPLEACLNDAAKREQSSRILEILSAQPTPPLVAFGDERFLPSSLFFAQLLQVPVQGPVINDVEELRFIPYTLTGTSLLLVVKEARSWDEAKTRKVLAVARLQQIRISLVWLDTQPPPVSLDLLVRESAGQRWLLSNLNRLVLDAVCTAKI